LAYRARNDRARWSIEQRGSGDRAAYRSPLAAERGLRPARFVAIRFAG